jgi:hypothetical protein
LLLYSPGFVLHQSHHVSNHLELNFCDFQERAIEKLLANSAVQYVHIRHSEAGCFIAQVNRVGG